jgi:hypothetical protein
MAAALLGAELVTRILVGGPYAGSTALLVLACGVSTLAFLPHELGRASVRLATVPALGVASFAALLTTISIAGVRLTEVSIRLAVVVLVVMLGALSRLPAVRADRRHHAPSGVEWIAVAGLLGVLAFALASAWDVVGPFPPPGVDWGHYLLYADEVEAQRDLLIEDPYAGEEGRLFADSPGVGALYGSARILDGIASQRLSYGIIVLSALTCLSMYAVAGALWGVRAGLLTSAAWAVAPIHIDPIRWHGVGTNLALLFVPLVLLGLGLLYRGTRGWRIVALLGTSLLGVAVAHSTSAVVIAFLLLAALVADLVHQAARGAYAPVQLARAWWRHGIVRPTIAGVLLAAAAGAGVVVHLRAQANDLGSPVDYRNFEPDWFSWRVVEDYYSLAFLALAAASVVLVWASRELRRDAALLALVAVAVAGVVVGQLWRLQVPFEYRRVVYYLGAGMAVLVGAGSLRLGMRTAAVGYAAILLYMAHVAIGLGLPGRLLSAPGQPKGRAAVDIMDFAEKIDRGELPDASLLVADRCHNFVVPYLLRRPTIVAFEPWQVGFESRVPLAERASAILAGDRAGRRLARSLGVGYVLANPSCTPELARRLDGRVVASTDGLVVVDVRDAAR